MTSALKGNRPVFCCRKKPTTQHTSTGLCSMTWFSSGHFHIWTPEMIIKNKCILYMYIHYMSFFLVQIVPHKVKEKTWCKETGQEPGHQWWFRLLDYFFVLISIQHYLHASMVLTGEKQLTGQQKRFQTSIYICLLSGNAQEDLLLGLSIVSPAALRLCQDVGWKKSRANADNYGILTCQHFRISPEHFRTMVHVWKWHV